MILQIVLLVLVAWALNHADELPSSNHFLPNEKDYPAAIRKCRLLFNELKLPSPTCNSHFLELIKSCEPGGYKTTHLPEGYRLMHCSCTKNEVYVWANFDGLELQADGPSRSKELLLLIGNSNTLRAQLQFSHSAFEYEGDEESTFANRENDGSFLILLKSEKKELDWLSLPPTLVDDIPKKGILQLTDLIKFQMRTRTQDVLIYSNSTLQDCPILWTVLPRTMWGNRHIVLPLPEDTGTSSLSRCGVTHIKPFDPYAWSLTELTPGRKNYCPAPFMPLLDINNPPNLPATDDDEDSATEQANLENNDESDEGQSNDVIPTVAVPLVSQGPRCKEKNLQNSRFNTHMPELKKLNDLIFSNYPPNLRLDQLPINPVVLNHINVHQSNMFSKDVITRKDIGWWLEHVDPDTDPAKAHLRCKLCHALRQNGNDADIDESKAVKKLMKAEGMLYTRRIQNDEEIASHPLERLHLDAEDYMKECYDGVKKEPVLDVIRAAYPPQEREFMATANVFLLAAAWAKSGAAIRQWPASIKTVAAMHGLVGRLYETREGLLKIVKAISTDIHESLLVEISKENPICVMIDAFQDKRGRHVLGIAFSMWYENKLKLITYRMQEMGTKLDSEAMFDTMRAAFRADGIDDYVRNSLVGFASDGAATNLGVLNSVLTRLRTWTGKEVESIWCYAHRINLVIQGAFKAGSFDTYVQLKRVMLVMKDLQNMFGARTSWRKRLLDVAKEQGIPPCIIQRTSTIRWSHVFRMSLIKIFRLYSCIIQVLQEIIDSSSTLEPKKLKAEGLIELMTLKHFAPSLAFMIDVFEVIDTFSLWAQKDVATRLNLAPFRARFMRSLRMLATQDGEYLSRFLSECDWVPSGGENIEEMSLLEMFEAGEDAVWRGQILKEPDDALPSDSPILLTNGRTAFIAGRILVLNKYFTEAESAKYLMFLPSTMGELVINEGLYDKEYQLHFLNFAKQMGFPFLPRHAMYTEWKALILILIKLPEFLAMKHLRASAFWLLVLNKDNLVISQNMVDFLNKVMVLPSGVVHIEGFFSQAGYTYGTRRLRLNVETADSILRIRRTVPKEVWTWDPFPYARRFLAKGNHRADDNTHPMYNKISPFGNLQEDKVVEINDLAFDDELDGDVNVVDIPVHADVEVEIIQDELFMEDEDLLDV